MINDLKEKHHLLSPQGSEVNIGIPSNLGKYMEALLSFTKHPSQVRRHKKKLINYYSIRVCRKLICLGFFFCSFWSHPLCRRGELCSDTSLCPKMQWWWRWPSNTSKPVWSTSSRWDGGCFQVKVRQCIVKRQKECLEKCAITWWGMMLLWPGCTLPSRISQ